MEMVFWLIAWALIMMPILLSVFTIFLMMTSPATDEDMFEDGSWSRKD